MVSTDISGLRSQKALELNRRFLFLTTTDYPLVIASSTVLIDMSWKSKGDTVRDQHSPHPWTRIFVQVAHSTCSFAVRHSIALDHRSHPLRRMSPIVHLPRWPRRREKNKRTQRGRGSDKASLSDKERQIEVLRMGTAPFPLRWTVFKCDTGEEKSQAPVVSVNDPISLSFERLSASAGVSMHPQLRDMTRRDSKKTEPYKLIQSIGERT